MPGGLALEQVQAEENLRLSSSGSDSGAAPPDGKRMRALMPTNTKGA